MNPRPFYDDAAVGSTHYQEKGTNFVTGLQNRNRTGSLDPAFKEKLERKERFRADYTKYSELTKDEQNDIENINSYLSRAAVEECDPNGMQISPFYSLDWIFRGNKEVS